CVFGWLAAGSRLAALRWVAVADWVCATADSVFAVSAWAFLTLGLASTGCPVSEAAGAASVFAAGESDAAVDASASPEEILASLPAIETLAAAAFTVVGRAGAAVNAMPVVATASAVGLACAVAAV